MKNRTVSRFRLWSRICAGKLFNIADLIRKGNNMKNASADSVVIDALRDRERNLAKWIRQECPECFMEQKHLDERTTERVYWHYGYLIAIRDFFRAAE